MGNVSRDENPKEEPKRNARDQKHCRERKNALMGISVDRT